MVTCGFTNSKVDVSPTNKASAKIIPQNRFDLALLKLSWPVVFTDKIRLTCLPAAGEELPDNYTCVVTGWGKLNAKGPKPRKLQQALLPAVEYDTCSRSDWWGTDVIDTMICVGGYSKTACEGDPGSPLNCFGSDGRWYINGVGSFTGSVPCNTARKPTVYTRVSAFNSWINDAKGLSGIHDKHVEESTVETIDAKNSQRIKTHIPPGKPATPQFPEETPGEIYAKKTLYGIPPSFKVVMGVLVGPPTKFDLSGVLSPLG
ncbi:chymotrypsin-like elastase family member 3B [Carcharodon carcharias]|uniref:chymotrypsin-like elastase family member 3B n=1 Tax=Carcharodon carcharias TaxID=13397 RepID=UPI001B7EDC79|nr:chymotrypsin-like elastase family member 3B [Carcharodon carcharias]